MVRKGIIAGVMMLAGAVAGLRLLLSTREDMTLEDADYPGKLINVDGHRLHYIEAGSGPAIILVHGFGGHTYSFRYTIPALAASHRVLALDVLGFGYSERPTKADYSGDAQARRVLGFMDAMGIDHATLLGHSMGGGIVMRAANIAPERVERLVLVASVSGDRIRGRLLPSWMVRPFLPAITRYTARRIFRRSFFNPANATPEIYGEYARPARIRGSRDGLMRILEDFRRDSAINFARVTQPALILWATGERILPRWSLNRLKKHLPQARVEFIERAGHLLLEEQPDECNRAIIAFLDEPLAAESRESVDTVASRA